MNPIQGLHHITAVARDPQRNVDFYHNVLGQRMIRQRAAIEPSLAPLSIKPILKTVPQGSHA